MKIVCGSCGAKYSIADEKVAGKSFKIRCRKCGDSIVVRGDSPSQMEASQPISTSSSEPPTTFDASSTGLGVMWHVVVDGEQQGPFSFDHISRLFTEGRITWEDFVWCEDFEDWKPLRDVSDLVDLLQRFTGEHAAIPHEVAKEAHADNLASDSSSLESQRLGASNSAGGPAAGEKLKSSTPFSMPRPDAAFTSPNPSAANPSANVSSANRSSASGAALASPRIDKLTGQRNENSVLFSLANLQALATGAERQSSATASGERTAASPLLGGASSEGSGLIDIRSIASAARRSCAGGPPSSTNGHKRSVDDLLSMGTAPNVLTSPLTAPLLAPVAIEQEKSNRVPMIALIGASAFFALAGVGALLFVLLRQPETAAPIAAAPTAGSPTAGSPMPTPAGAPSPANVQPGGTNANGAQGATAGISAKSSAEGNAKSKSAGAQNNPSSSREGARRGRANSSGDNDSKTSRGGRGADGTQVASSDNVAKESASRGKETKGGGDIDSLIAAAIGGDGKKPRAARGEENDSPSASADLPEVPPRNDVLQALRSVQDGVKACGQGGVANTTIVVRGSTGAVSDVSVSGAFAGTPTASCIGRSVKRAQFPRFKRSTFTVTFPYAL